MYNKGNEWKTTKGLDLQYRVQGDLIQFKYHLNTLTREEFDELARKLGYEKRVTK
jgi:hypothetical protein